LLEAFLVNYEQGGPIKTTYF